MTEVTLWGHVSERILIHEVAQRMSMLNETASMFSRVG
jgi:hypothetical protein